jgi:hypothetical protein
MSAYAGISGDVWLSTSPPTALGSPENATDSGDHIHLLHRDTSGVGLDEDA